MAKHYIDPVFIKLIVNTGNSIEIPSALNEFRYDDGLRHTKYEVAAHNRRLFINWYTQDWGKTKPFMEELKRCLKYQVDQEASDMAILVTLKINPGCKKGIPTKVLTFEVAGSKHVSGTTTREYDLIQSGGQVDKYGRPIERSVRQKNKSPHKIHLGLLKDGQVVRDKDNSKEGKGGE